MQKIEIKYSHGVEHLSSAHPGEWIDLRCGENVSMKKGEIRNLSLGVAMKLPEGFEAHVLPRSSTLKHFGIVMLNGMGIIDNLYSGNDDIWQFPALALRDTEIKVNDRIAQFRIVPVQGNIFLKTVFDLKGESRGGFGSTGK